MRLVVHPARRPLQGRTRPPGDKSVSHRLAILGALAEGETVITGYLDSADTHATLEAVRALGAVVRLEGEALVVAGAPWRVPENPLDLGNSGTGMRLLAGALAGHPALFGESVTLTGDDSLSRRPMRRIIDPLSLMGADIGADSGHAPLLIRPRALTGASHELPVASAQVKSAILLAGLQAHGDTFVREPAASRDHTERLLPAFGAVVACSGRQVHVRGPQSLRGCEAQVPGDLSSAAFILAAGLLVPESEVIVDDVGLNPTRDGILRIFERMGAEFDQVALPGLGDEPMGQLTARATPLAGTQVPPEWVPLAIDEFPLLMAVAAASEGETVITGAAELRVKESDRLALMSVQLQRLGVRVEEQPDGARVWGGPVRGGTVTSGGDHRIAMSLAVLALVAEEPVVIEEAQWLRTSYPGFVEDLTALGAEAAWQS